MIEKKDLPFWFQNVSLEELKAELFNQPSYNNLGFYITKNGKTDIYVSMKGKWGPSFCEVGYDYEEEGLPISYDNDELLEKFLVYMAKVNQGRKHEGKTYIEDVKERNNKMIKQIKEDTINNAIINYQQTRSELIRLISKVESNDNYTELTECEQEK